MWCQPRFARQRHERRWCPPPHLDGKKEAIARGDPALVIGRETTGRNHTMQMGIMVQFLIPTMEHAEKADFAGEWRAIAPCVSDSDFIFAGDSGKPREQDVPSEDLSPLRQFPARR